MARCGGVHCSDHRAAVMIIVVCGVLGMWCVACGALASIGHDAIKSAICVAIVCQIHVIVTRKKRIDMIKVFSVIMVVNDILMLC